MNMRRSDLKKDVNIIRACLSNLPKYWCGKRCILELKNVNYNWKQMEWLGFYFEYLCRNRLSRNFSIPGERINNTQFDSKRSINWDFKAKAIKSDDHRSILNDVDAMDWSINRYGAHGLIVAMCDVEYNDEARTFQKWHSELKGGLSAYEKERRKRTSLSRYRKTSALLQEILLCIIDVGNAPLLGIHSQGRNSNGRPRPPKHDRFRSSRRLYHEENRF